MTLKMHSCAAAVRTGDWKSASKPRQRAADPQVEATVLQYLGTVAPREQPAPRSEQPIRVLSPPREERHVRWHLQASGTRSCDHRIRMRVYGAMLTMGLLIHMAVCLLHACPCRFRQQVPRSKCQAMLNTGSSTSRTRTSARWRTSPAPPPAAGRPSARRRWTPQRW